MNFLLDIAVSLIPVFAFLVSLIFLDSFKLIKSRLLASTIIWGAGIALLCYWINDWALQRLFPDSPYFTRYGSPVIEEVSKGAFLVFLLRSKRIGFMVDAAIYGFAIGAGFAFTENIYYVHAMPEAGIFLWIIRGFGTAIMHGGTTAMLGIISKTFLDRYPSKPVQAFVPGICLVVAVHSVFNHFFLPPVVTTLLLLLILPAMLGYVFKRSELRTREWLGVNLDADMELLNLINTGNLSDSKIGQYLYTLKTRFSAEIIIDMICLLRLHTELSIKSKGILMMKDAGFAPPPNPEVKEKFDEMKYLERSIGRTGKMAILPFLHTSSQSLWQIYMLED
jgi:RsiW-degrading membrane proteinase PrsW (M82 family)